MIITWTADINITNLQNVVIGGEIHGADVDVNVAVIEKFPGQLLHFLGPGSGPHHHLSVGPDLLENLPDLGLESHVQHPVSLVQTEVGGPPQIDLSGLQKINEPAGSRNTDLHAILDVPQLRALRSPAKHAGVLDATGFAELISDLLNLLGQLPVKSLSFSCNEIRAKLKRK